MQTSSLGNTGLEASRLGVGLAEIGSELTLDDVGQAGELLNRALDSGINFLDTAACYGVSEELIGRTVANRRREYTLASKAGHASGLPTESWTYETVAASVDRSLERMKTDVIDILQLHSCGVDVLEKGDVVRALQDARAAGKIRYVSYSGDNEAAHWAVDSGLFSTLQTTFNVSDQRAFTTGLLEKAADRGMGVIIKRPIAGGTWRVARHSKDNPRVRSYDQPYVERATALASDGPVPGEPEDAIEFSLGFVLSHPQVTTAIVGTKNPRHMESNLRMIEEGIELPPNALEEMHSRFARHDDGWVQRG
jgi:aryl-alcohol dehydrogenase-like predicted oxidoreductase